MTRLSLMIVAIAAGITFAAAVPTIAVAGIQAVYVPAKAAPERDAACVEQKEAAASLVIVTCKKKAQSGKVTLCQQVHAVVPVALRAPAVPESAVSRCRVEAARPDAHPERLHRPPRA